MLPLIPLAIAGGTALAGIAGSWLQSEATKKASKEASTASAEATNAAIEEQRRQFEIMQEALRPYTEAGQSALQSQLALTGALGSDAEMQAINSISQGPAFQNALNQGENSILQNASATGGIRGGNVQSALAQYSPALLNSMIQQRYSQLGGLTQLGQASAAGVGSAGLSTVSNARTR